MATGNIFIRYLPYSLLVFIIPVVVYWMFKREKSASIDNRVEVFFKGGTKKYFDCTAGKEEINFTIDEVDYKEPILYHPRIEHDKGKMWRTFLFAEGVGMVDVPPLTRKDRDKILKYLVDNSIITKEDKKTNFDDYTDEDLIKYIRFYNFDIEQITDKPIWKSFTMSMNAWVSLTEGIINRAKFMERSEQSNLAKIGYVIMGILIGFGFAWALSQKGII